MTGNVTVKKKFGPTATMTSTIPFSISLRRISPSLWRASDDELAITNPARPVSLRDVAKSWIQR